METVSMNRRDVTLVLLALAEGEPYKPVQLQKTIFLTSEKAKEIFDKKSRFNFEPYDYGPFDKAVYQETEILELCGLAEIDRNGRWYQYSATKEGIARAQELMKEIPDKTVDLLKKISKLVRSLSFEELVSAIYDAYPEMRENSIFVK